MKKRIKHVLLGCMAACILLILGTAFFSIHDKSVGWKPLRDIKEYEGMYDSPITVITLRKTVDSAEWVVFDDSDLIEKWEIFLEGLEVLRENPLSQSDKNVNGGIRVVSLKTETSDYSLYLRNISDHEKFEIDGFFYAFKSPVEIPFSETYSLAAKRHGTVSPWN